MCHIKVSYKPILYGIADRVDYKPTYQPTYSKR